MKRLLERVHAYCLAKPGVTSTSKRHSRLGYNILGQTPTFVWEIAFDENPVRLVIRCYNRVLETLSEGMPVKIPQRINPRTWYGKDWKWVDVWLDGTIPETELFRLLDDAYQIGITELDETDVKLIEIAGRGLTMREALQALIDSNQLQHRRGEIEALTDTALLLNTYPADESTLALGQTKIGGSPDLPDGWTVPIFDGKPLAFLAQINLTEIPPAFRKSQLPRSGVLYFFSMFGWADDETANWDTAWWSGSTEAGFSQVLYYDGALASLKRWIAPEHLSAFKAAGVKFLEVLSLPRGGNYSRDPVVARLDWSEEEFDQLDELYFDFDYVLGQMGLASGHKLLGYAEPVHEVVTTEDTQLLFEMFTGDENLGRIPDDGGIIYFTIAHSDFAEKNFSHIQAAFHFD